MKTVRNKLRQPLRVPLPRGKTLHLGPGQEGKINDHAVDHEPFRRLVEAEQIEIVDEGRPGHAGHGGGPGSVHARTHGFHGVESHNRGDR